MIRYLLVLGILCVVAAPAAAQGTGGITIIDGNGCIVGRPCADGVPLPAPANRSTYIIDKDGCVAGDPCPWRGASRQRIDSSGGEVQRITLERRSDQRVGATARERIIDSRFPTASDGYVNQPTSFHFARGSTERREVRRGEHAPERRADAEMRAAPSDDSEAERNAMIGVVLSRMQHPRWSKPRRPLPGRDARTSLTSKSENPA